MGLANQWPRICKVYALVNELLGDIVKVTPTSKAVGDLALFMVANDLSCEDIIQGRRELAYPASVLDLVGGMMGQPPGGFPPAVEKAILKDKAPVKCRPGEELPPADFEKTALDLQPKLSRPATDQDIVTSLLYPKVFDEFIANAKEYGNLSLLPTPSSSMVLPLAKRP